MYIEVTDYVIWQVQDKLDWKKRPRYFCRRYIMQKFRKLHKCYYETWYTYWWRKIYISNEWSIYELRDGKHIITYEEVYEGEIILLWYNRIRKIERSIDDILKTKY